MRLFFCSSCGAQLYFESHACLSCHSPLGFSVDQQSLLTLRASGDAPDEFREVNSPDTPALRPCANRRPGDCNWLLTPGQPGPYCLACSLSETIPALGDEDGRRAWVDLERAKRRLLFGLMSLGLPVTSKLEEPRTGLAFRFVESTENFTATTGHVGGVITINVAEADPAYRERERQRLGEPYRTVLGHLRHESGHYYFERLVMVDQALLAECRARFGDERADYQAAQRTHYHHGPPAGWEQRCVSAYATMHPWEDWAETWAHYLHVVDTLETARSYGLALHAPPAVSPVAAGGAPSSSSNLAPEPPERPREHPFLSSSKPPMGQGQGQGLGQISQQGQQNQGQRRPLLRTRRIDFGDFEQLMQSWTPVALALNGLNRSMGLQDAYPFAISSQVRGKLAFVHRVVDRA